MPIVARLEWRIARRRPRTFALNVAIPLALVTPVALGAAPAPHAAAVYTVLFALFGTFGSAIPLIRDGEDGILQRIVLTGIPPRRLVVERILAQTTLDAVQLLPALLLIGWAGDPDARLAGALPALLVATLLAANALGAWVAALARSIAEGALFAAIATLFALHAGGVFRTPAPGTVAAAIERLVPFRYLHEALLETAGLPAAPATATLIAAPLAGAAAALAIAAAFAPALIGRLARMPHA